MSHQRFSGHELDSLHAELPHRTRAFDLGGIVSDVGGVFKGVAEGAVDTVTGIADAVTNPVDTAKGIASLVTDPKESWPALWHGLTNPIVEDWKNGNEGEAIGRGIFGVLEVIVGSKGVSKVGKVIKKGPDAPEAPRTPKPDPAKPDAPVHDARTAAALITLEQSGANFSKDAIRFADELPEGSPIKSSSGVAFLETGNGGAGLQHILHGNPATGSKGHLQDFANRGVPEAKVPDLLREAVTTGDVTRVPGKRGTYDVVVDFEGTQQKLRMAIGTNGFIVSAVPI